MDDGSKASRKPPVNYRKIRCTAKRSNYAAAANKTPVVGSAAHAQNADEDRDYYLPALGL
jgi:hypothetical protein